MPKGRISTKGFSDIINDYDNPERLKELYFYLYVSGGISFEALLNWRVVKDPNIRIRRKKPMKFVVGSVKDADAFNADTNKLKYTKPEMVEEDYSLDQRLEVGRQYSTLDINTPDFMDSEMVEVTDIEKQLKREAIMNELQANANSYKVDAKANAYDVWETIFKAARKTGINLNKMILLVQDSLLLEWRRLKLFENQNTSEVTINKLEENPLNIDNAFKDKISGVTFIALPDVYEAIATDGTVREVKLFKDKVKAVFWEDSATVKVLDCVTMEHTALRIVPAAGGTGYGNVQFMEKISYYGCNLLEPKKAGQIVADAAPAQKLASVEPEEANANNDELDALKKEVEALNQKLKDTGNKSKTEINDLKQQLKEAKQQLKTSDEQEKTRQETAQEPVQATEPEAAEEKAE